MGSSRSMDGDHSPSTVRSAYLNPANFIRFSPRRQPRHTGPVAQITGDDLVFDEALQEGDLGLERFPIQIVA